MLFLCDGMKNYSKRQLRCFQGHVSLLSKDVDCTVLKLTPKFRGVCVHMSVQVYLNIYLLDNRKYTLITYLTLLGISRREGI